MAGATTSDFFDSSTALYEGEFEALRGFSGIWRDRASAETIRDAPFCSDRDHRRDSASRNRQLHIQCCAFDAGRVDIAEGPRHVGRHAHGDRPGERLPAVARL